MNGKFLYYQGVYAEAEKYPFLLAHALHYATSVFEGIRVYNGAPFLLEEHLSRLITSCELIGIDCPATVQELSKICYNLIDKTGVQNAYLRPVVFKGGPDLGVYAPKNTIELSVIIWEWPSVFGAAAVSKGISLTSDIPYRRPPPTCFPTQAKSSAAYLIGAINRQKAENDGFNDALLFTHAGMVAEATGANIFLVNGNTVTTPPANDFLNGLTRQTVIGLLASGQVEEREITLDDVKSADEVFLTGTAYEVIGVSKIDDCEKSVGQFTSNIRNAYLKLTKTTNLKGAA